MAVCHALINFVLMFLMFVRNLQRSFVCMRYVAASIISISGEVSPHLQGLSVYVQGAVPRHSHSGSERIKLFPGLVIPDE